MSDGIHGLGEDPPARNSRISRPARRRGGKLDRRPLLPDSMPQAVKRSVLAGAERSLNNEYAIRDVVAPAKALEAQGHKILQLNIGDPSTYGFHPPAHLVEALGAAARENLNSD